MACSRQHPYFELRNRTNLLTIPSSKGFGGVNRQKKAGDISPAYKAKHKPITG